MSMFSSNNLPDEDQDEEQKEETPNPSRVMGARDENMTSDNDGQSKVPEMSKMTVKSILPPQQLKCKYLFLNPNQ